MPPAPQLLLGAGGFSGGALFSALAQWACERPAVPLPVLSGPYTCSCEPCNSCCSELNWSSVFAFISAEALELGPGYWGLILLGLLLGCIWLGGGLRVQVVIAPDGAPDAQGPSRVQAIARALRP